LALFLAVLAILLLATGLAFFLMVLDLARGVALDGLAAFFLVGVFFDFLAGAFFFVFDNPDDGRVSVEDTKLDGMTGISQFICKGLGIADAFLDDEQVQVLVHFHRQTSLQFFPKQPGMAGTVVRRISQAPTSKFSAIW